MSEVAVFDPRELSQYLDTPFGKVHASFLAINDGDIHRELSVNSEDFAYWANFEEQVNLVLKQLEQDLEEREAELWGALKVRKQNGEKLTVEDIRAEIRLDDTVKKIKRDMVQTAFGLSQVQNIRKAIWRKGDLLQAKVHLKRSEMQRQIEMDKSEGMFKNTERMISNE